ncbi:MAG TPA: sugar ABC transporter permease [Bacteroidetes bacterium]|nr:sugar ABC transporter permease [Bacteroidota bacterium]
MMKYVRYGILLLGVIIAVTPFLWLLSTSLKGAEELFLFPPTIIPVVFVWENYSGLWDAVPLGTYFINTIIITIVSVVLNVLLSRLAGFALAREQFKYKQTMFYLIVASLLIPKEVIILPLYTIILKIHLSDNLAGVVLPFIVDGMSIFMMRQAFLSIPKEIEEAGIMDGASPFVLWWKVMLPMTKPMMATLTIFTFIASWGDFLWPLVVLKSPEHFTLQVGLSYLIGTFVDNFRFVAAGGILSIIPVIIVFILMQKYFERGLFAGSGR